MSSKEYPLEKVYNLESNPDHIGRVCVFPGPKGFQVEIDILVKDSHKIYQNIGVLFEISDEQEAFDQGTQLLSRFLRGEYKI